MEIFSVQNFFLDFGKIVAGASFLWLPVVLFYFLAKIWKHYITVYFINNIEWVLLEIKLPREIMKGPAAMEMVLNAMYQTRDASTLVKKYWDGLVRAWYSMEITSVNGQIHFYIYVQKGLKSLIEHQIYAQYPGVEITESADYTKTVSSHNEGDLNFYSAEVTLNKEDAYPIKTYVDYGLQNLMSEEEQRNDPMTSLLEFMGSLKQGEQVWFQVLIRATKNDEWKDSGKAIVDKIMKREKKEASLDFSSLTVSPGERLVAEAIERNVSKLGFDVCIRMAYLAEKDKYNSSIRGVLGGVMQQYNAHNLNGFKLTNATLYLDYFFQFPTARHSRRQRVMFDAYVKRAGFYTPYKRKLFVLNTEELATIYHFPGAVAKTPALPRIEAKKGEPPAGLPV